MNLRELRALALTAVGLGALAVAAGCARVGATGLARLVLRPYAAHWARVQASVGPALRR